MNLRTCSREQNKRVIHLTLLACLTYLYILFEFKSSLCNERIHDTLPTALTQLFYARFLSSFTTISSQISTYLNVRHCIGRQFASAVLQKNIIRVIYYAQHSISNITQSRLSFEVFQINIVATQMRTK